MFYLTQGNMFMWGHSFQAAMEFCSQEWAENLQASEAAVQELFYGLGPASCMGCAGLAALM